MTAQFNEMMKNAPAWLTPEMVLIGGGVLVALVLVWLIGRLTRRRPEAEAEADYAEVPPARPITPLPVAPAPPVIAEPPLAPPPPPVFAPEPPVEEPAAIADEPIAAAAPFDASPASLAADVAAPEPAAPSAAAADDLTRLKGVGPRLADRLNTVGITSFAQIAALTPAEAEALDAKLGDFQGRIHRDRWIEQSGFLAAGDVAGFEDKFGKL